MTSRGIQSLQNTIDQGTKLKSVDLTADGDFSFHNERPFLLDLPSSGAMKVQFPDGEKGVYNFREGTSPIVKLIKVFDVDSEIKQFQVVY